MQRITRLGMFAGLGVALLLLASCFQSRFPLGPREPGKVDLGYVGDWTLLSRDEQGESHTSRLLVRNLHNDEYYVEWAGEEDRPFRATAYLSEVGGASFANVLPITDDGSIAKQYIILRVDRAADGSFSLRNLNGEFFKGKPFNSSDELRKMVAENLENSAMYRGEPLLATRQADGP